MDSFIASYKTVTRLMRQSGMSSAWFDKPSILYSFYCFLTNTVCITIILLEIGVVFWVDYDAPDLAAWATMITVNICGLVSSFCCYAYAGKISKLIQSFDLTTEITISFEEYSFPDDDNFIKYCGKFIKLYSSYTVAMACFATAFYHSPVWIIDIMNNCYRTHLAYKIYLPYRHNVTGLYEFTWTFQAAGFIVPAIKKGSVEILVLSLMHQLVKHFACLRVLIGRILKKPSGEENELALKKWFHLHQLILKNYKEIIQIQAPVIAMNYINMVTLAACILYIGTHDQRLSMFQMMAAWIYFFFALFEIFLICAMFEKVSNEVSNIGNDVYFSDWHLMKKETANNLRMVIVIVQKPLTPAYCSEVLRLNHKSFLNTLGSIISTYLAFLKLEDIVSMG